MKQNEEWAALKIIMYSSTSQSKLITKWDLTTIFHNYSFDINISEADFIAKMVVLIRIRQGTAEF